jgi:hypothetical protein
MIAARGASTSLTKTQGVIDDTLASLDECRGWWLEEHYALTSVLDQVPQPIRARLETIAEASRDRFAAYSRCVAGQVPRPLPTPI